MNAPADVRRQGRRLLAKLESVNLNEPLGEGFHAQLLDIACNMAAYKEAKAERRKARAGGDVVNHRVELEGRAYRVATLGRTPLLVALKCSAGGERLLDHDGPTFARVVAQVQQ